MSRTLVRIIVKMAQRRDRPLKFSFDDLATTQVGSKKPKQVSLSLSLSSFFPLAFSPRSIVRRNFTFTSELTFYDPYEVLQDLSKEGYHKVIVSIDRIAVQDMERHGVIGFGIQ